MTKDIPITEARHELTSLPERLADQDGAVAITRRGKPVLAIMPWELRARKRKPAFSLPRAENNQEALVLLRVS